MHVSLQTLYTCSSRVEPADGAQGVVVGCHCKLRITLTRSRPADQPGPETSLMYKVNADKNTWMISGKTTGVVSLATVAMATCDVVLDVMPLTGGNLSLPEVKVMKYMAGREEPEAKDLGEKGAAAAPGKARPSLAPTVTPFACGQVYNSTQAVQVCVLPSNSEVTVGF